ncbi:MAG: glycoside hydrolase domain-containing protein [Thermoguttaceae bacterium]|jgi:hypothetical protein
MQWMIPLMMVLATGAEPTIPESVATHGAWPHELGNHRAVVRVNGRADAVWIHLPWRRRDVQPENKHIVVVDAGTGKRLANVVVVRVTPACGDVVFQPTTAPGNYHVYYLPASQTGRGYFPEAAYDRPQDTAEQAWRSRVGLMAAGLRQEAWRMLPPAQLVAFEVADAFDQFTPMEQITTADEVARLLAADARAAYWLFPEDREHPIRMSGHLPKRWVDAGPRDYFEGKARRGEFYVFQIGLYAARRALADVKLAFDDLRPRSVTGRPIPAAAIRCFNQGGIGFDGQPFFKTIAVDQGKVAALWFGVQVPADAEPGWYDGTVCILPKGEATGFVALRLQIDPEVLSDAGDSQPWRLSRLRWLDSTIASDDQPVAPFTPLVIQRKKVAVLGRDVALEMTGLPGSIRSYFAPEVTHLTNEGRPLLAGPIRFVAELADGSSAAFSGDDLRFVKRSSGAAAWQSTSRAGDLRLCCRGELEFDGHAAFHLEVTADRATPVSDLRLEIPLCREAARYMMGMGRPGGLRPARFDWHWDHRFHQDSLWLGDVNAGLRCQLFGENYRRPLINCHYHDGELRLPPAWWNDGRGGCTVREESGDRVVFRAASGQRTIQPGQTLHFNFSLLVTPLKPLVTDNYWTQRHYLYWTTTVIPLEQIQRAGTNIVSIHHGTVMNPFLNYPLVRDEALKRFVDAAHATGLKATVYYETRELSNHAVELWALRSLGDEVLAPGAGGGPAWLQAHLDPPYVSGWCMPNVGDVAIVTTSTSRWDNFYLEGLDWLARNVGIDGIYIDDTAFDRTVMKRARKILDRRRPGASIDLHSWNHFCAAAGYACCLDLYLEHLPYIDRIWLGEGRDYNTPPDYWLVEISGIPFGLMGEMLQDGGNPWRGMIYGMTGRLPHFADPRPMWKLWEEFHIQGSQMIGYWMPGCPVHTDNPAVLATVYRHPRRALISIASWAPEKINCRLSIDFTRLGVDPAKARLRAPAVAKFQPSATFPLGDAIPVEPARGWLLILDESR